MKFIDNFKLKLILPKNIDVITNHKSPTSIKKHIKHLIIFV